MTKREQETLFIINHFQKELGKMNDVFMTTDEVCDLLRCSKYVARKIGKKAHAVRKVGRSYLYNKRILIEYMNNNEVE